ncbi:MAG: hypothetical protein IJ797_09755 [Selenomonadaceae bacterium]|nr:hypothetical protein [Selenomonadaceae bacterium]
MKSEQKRIKHWLRIQQNQKRWSNPYIPNIDYWSDNALQNSLARILALRSIANRKK